MKYYIELTLIPHPDSRMYGLWSKLYTQLHLALVNIKDADDTVKVGISLPEYRFDETKKIGSLGSKIRLFANEQATLERLNIQQWLNRFTDYVHITSIRKVPERIKGYARYSRVQVKTNAERLARHRLKKHQDLSFEQAVARYQKIITTCPLPYVQLTSLTNEYKFKLFIKKEVVEDIISTIAFNTYGLSNNCALPEF